MLEEAMVQRQIVTRTVLTGALTLAVALGINTARTAARAAGDLTPGKVDLKSAGALAFGPNGVLFVGDNAAGDANKIIGVAGKRWEFVNLLRGNDSPKSRVLGVDSGLFASACYFHRRRSATNLQDRRHFADRAD